MKLSGLGKCTVIRVYVLAGISLPFIIGFHIPVFLVGDFPLLFDLDSVNACSGEKMLQENGIELSGGQGHILFVLWKTDHLTVSENSERICWRKIRFPSC